MDLVADVIPRVRAFMPTLRAVGGAADLDAAMRPGARITPPMAYVMPLGERAGAAQGRTAVLRQPVSCTFGVVLVIQALRDNEGREALQALSTLRAQLSLGLVGWVPDADTGEQVTYLGGELVQFEGDGRLWWSDEFQHTTHVRRVP